MQENNFTLILLNKPIRFKSHQDKMRDILYLKQMHRRGAGNFSDIHKNLTKSTDWPDNATPKHQMYFCSKKRVKQHYSCLSPENKC